MGAFLPPSRLKAKTPPRGQQAEGAAWGLFFAAEPPQGKNAPSGGSKPKAQRGGFFPFFGRRVALIAVTFRF